MKREEILAAAASIPDAEAREAYLVTACKGDAGMVTALRTTLDDHTRLPNAAATRLSLPGDSTDSGSKTPLEAAGVCIGPYQLTRVLGSGGMATVWLAQQEQPVRRSVALKVIKAGMDSQQVIARFSSERQVLAIMDHPNIAKVLDAGTTVAGRPYFVMEVVDGESVTQYCQNRELGLRERLALVIQICHALQHAHQKGIIHRDIKPSNILVAEYDGIPVPKVIDFGIAKATGPSADDSSQTQAGMFIGTLEYMSPEQTFPGTADIDTRSDIYSMGVVL